MSENPTPAYFAILPAPVRYAAKLPATAKLLYAEITSLANDTGYCYARNVYFARLYGLSLQSVQRLIKALADRGLVSVDVQRDPATRQVTERRIYVGVLDVLEDSTPPLKNKVTPPLKNRATPSPQKQGIEQFNNISNNTPYIPQGDEGECAPNEREMDTKKDADATDLFDRFWAAYPRKEGKARARKAWDKLRPDVPLCRQMSFALKQQKRTPQWTRDGGQYIPHPASWLNGRRWEDELLPQEAIIAHGGDSGVYDPEVLR